MLSIPFNQTMNIHAVPDSSRCVKAVKLNASSSFPQFLLLQDSTRQSFPLPNDPAGLYNTSGSSVCDELAQAGRKFVKVSGLGVVEVNPDVVVFCVKITSRKSDLNLCRASIKKREDYVVSILKKNHVHQYQSTELIHKDTIKTEDGQGDREDGQLNEENCTVCVVKEICVTADEVGKYFNILATCQEKLDSRVEVTRPVISVSAGAVEKAMSSALEQAKKNAHSKALALVQSKRSEFRMSVGSLLYAMENSVTVSDLKEFENCDGVSMQWKRLGKRISVEVTTVYELRTERDKNYKVIL